MGFLTIRTVFDRETVLGLLTENEFRSNLALGAAANMRPFNDHYLGFFVLRTEPSGQGDLMLHIASSTVVGIQRYTTTRLKYQGIYLAPNPRPDGLLVELLRAHYRGEEEDTFERLSSISGLPLRWTKRWYANGAGDLQNPPQFSISDPEIDELNKLFSLRDDRPGETSENDETEG